MKKFLGAVMVLLGTCAVGLGGLALYESCTMQEPYMLLSIGFILLGIVLVVVGRDLYRAKGESAKTKRVMGVLMMILGLFLAVFGAVFAFVWTVLDTSPAWFLGAESLVMGLIYLLCGKRKFSAGKTAQGESPDRKNDASRKSGTAGKKQDPPPQPEPKVMLCPECGKQFPLDQVYCDECGSLLKPSK